MFRSYLIIGFSALSVASSFAAGPSVEEGARLATIGGCHDCHSAGFAESGGKVDAATALMGNSVGYQGPWGTTYPANLRLVLSTMTEDQFVTFSRNLETRPPMPWFGLRAMTDDELRSIYLYVKSLGSPGAPAPEYVKPGETPKTPYIVFAPPQMPGK